ncbi:MAG: ABC transporter ATP-binding protein [Spirochaetaceae bacterium]
MLTIKGVSKKYGSITAVEDINFSLEKGEVVGLLGVNGAGKTTAMNMITGYFPPTAGTINLLGCDVMQEPLEYKRNIGYLPENPPLYLDMTIREQLRFVCSARGIPRTQWEGEIERVCSMSSILDVQHRIIRTMSKGYKQRIGIAQALIGEPKLLVLDEPTSGLDPQQIIEIRELIEKLKSNHTVMISSHILSEVSSVSTRIVILHRGKIVADQPVEDLLLSSEETPVLWLRVFGNADAVGKLISDIPGVEDVEVRESPEQGCSDYDIHFAEGCDARRELSGLLAGHGYAIMAMTIKSKTLEDIFIELLRE